MGARVTVDRTLIEADARVRTCGAIIRRLPGERRTGYGRAWPETIVEFGDVVAQLEPGGQGNRPVTNAALARERLRVRPRGPTAVELKRIDAVLGWLADLRARDADMSFRILALRMHRASFAAIGEKLLLSGETVRRRYYTILCEFDARSLL